MWPSGDRRKVLGPTLCFFFLTRLQRRIRFVVQTVRIPIRGVSIEMKQLGVEDAKLLFHLII
jgi:hypothetical protein